MTCLLNKTKRFHFAYQTPGGGGGGGGRLSCERGGDARRKF